MSRYVLGEGRTLVIERGDITKVEVDAVVNAANPSLMGGGGVDGAIHRAAGRELLLACRDLPKNPQGVRCITGEARITPGFELPARFVIHTVGPIYHRIPRADSRRLLALAHRSSLQLARDSNLETVAFPAISCGAYRFPLDEAATIALETCRDFSEGLREVRFVHFTQATLDAWTAAAEGLFAPA